MTGRLKRYRHLRCTFLYIFISLAYYHDPIKIDGARSTHLGDLHIQFCEENKRVERQPGGLRCRTEDNSEMAWLVKKQVRRKWTGSINKVNYKNTRTHSARDCKMETANTHLKVVFYSTLS
jgi:hypothetical protein